MLEMKVAVIHTDVGHEVRMSRPRKVDRGRTAMKHCAGLDVSVKETAIDESGKIVGKPR